MLAACGVPDQGSVDGPSTPPNTHALGTVRLPDDVGSPIVQRLNDGTPVWVANLGDEEVSVLSATVLFEAPEPSPGAIRGLRMEVFWDTVEQVFHGGGTWDLRGQALAPDGRRVAGRLDHYHVTVADDRTAVVHEFVPGEPGVVQDPPATEEASMPIALDPDTLRFVLDGLDAPLSVEEALTQPDGSVVVVDADIVRNGSQPLVICATDRSAPSGPEIARCPDGAPRPAGLTVPVPDTRTFEIKSRPLLVRVKDGTFTDVAQLGGGTAAGAGSDESLAVSEATRVTVADGSVAVVEGWDVVELRGSDVCAVLSQPRTLYVIRGRVEPCDQPLPPSLPGAIVRAIEDDPATADRLRTGTAVPLYGTPGRAADDATEWIHPDVFTYDYIIPDLGIIVSTADDPHPDELYSYLDTEALLQSLRADGGSPPAGSQR